jgi:TPR repeat protein
MWKFKLVFYLVFPIFFTSISLLGQKPETAPLAESAHGRLEELSKKALAGDTKAQLQMGLAYEFGNGAEKNIDRAMHWYRIAADRGDPVAQTDLGYLYETGANGPKDQAEAAKWYMRAALAGLTRAKFNLGVLYLAGSGVGQNIREGAHWVGEAAEDGCPSALVSMSYLYANGLGVPRNAQKSSELRRKAAKTMKHDAKLCMTLNPAVSATSVASVSPGIE